jgi:adrenodoxin-NADP+ reductase
MIRSVLRQRLSHSLAQHTRLLRDYHHIAIVGTGPSGFYTAKYCLDLHPTVRVDLFERLPTPYGLVRAGVAPDHPEVKTVEETFLGVANSPRVRFFGNVEVGDAYADRSGSSGDSGASGASGASGGSGGAGGGDGGGSGTGGAGGAPARFVSLQSLRADYSAVVLAHGASGEHSLRIPGEHLRGVVSSRAFVNWYNGHPEYAHLHAGAGTGVEAGVARLDLSRTKHVVVVGQGNVALDCARILTKSAEELAVTDIAAPALKALGRSAVQSVTLLGRRGHIQSAFTIKELRELTRLKGVKVQIDLGELEMGRTGASLSELEGNRPKKRIVELIEKVAAEAEAGADAGAGVEAGVEGEPADRVITIRYLTSPLEVLGSDNIDNSSSENNSNSNSNSSSSSGDSSSSMDAGSHVVGLRIARTQLQGEPFQQRAVMSVMSVGEGKGVPGFPALPDLPCDLLITSVGYRSAPLSSSVPFDTRSNTVPHLRGRVLGAGAAGVAGVAGVDAPAEPKTAVGAVKDADAVGADAGTADAEAVDAGLYVTGWLKRGATGIIASNVPDAKETAASIGEDLRAGHLSELSDTLLGVTDVTDVTDVTGVTDVTVDAQAKDALSLAPVLPWMAAMRADIETQSAGMGMGVGMGAGAGGHAQGCVVGWAQYLKIDAEEKSRGAQSSPPKIRDKITSVAEMLAIAVA